MMTFKITKARTHHLYQIANLTAAVNPRWTYDVVLREFVRPRNIFLVMLKSDEEPSPRSRTTEEVSGVCILWHSPDELHILNIVVAPRYQRLGIGKKLLENVHLIAQDLNLERIVLEVRVSNQAAISLYESSGFQKINVRKDYYTQPREDAFVFIKELNTLEA